MMEILAYTPTTLAEAMHASRPTVYAAPQHGQICTVAALISGVVQRAQ